MLQVRNKTKKSRFVHQEEDKKLARKYISTLPTRYYYCCILCIYFVYLFAILSNMPCTPITFTKRKKKRFFTSNINIFVDVTP